MTYDRPLQHTQPGGNRSKIVFPDPPLSQDTATAGSETQAKGPRADPAESKKKNLKQISRDNQIQDTTLYPRRTNRERELGIAKKNSGEDPRDHPRSPPSQCTRVI